MKLLKTFLAWIANTFTRTPKEETKMPDDLIQSGVVADTALIAADVPATPTALILPTPAAANTPAVAAAPAVLATPAAVVAPVNTDTLKALLLTLGHDIEAEWEHLVALAKKAL